MNKTEKQIASQHSECRRLGVFFVTALALGIAPGPDILFVLTQALSRGSSAGFFVTLGLCTGLCFHVTLAAFGIAAVLKRYPKLFTAVTWCGVLYLLYLAFLAARAASALTADPNDTAVLALSPLRLWLRGVVMNVCNPKVMLFFLALLPRFTRPERGHLIGQFLLLGGLFAIATFLVFNVVSLLAGNVSRFLVQTPDAFSRLQYFSAVMMVGLAVWIAVLNIRSNMCKPSDKSDPSDLKTAP